MAQGALGFGSGLAKGLANGLLSYQERKREDERRKADQERQVDLAFLNHAINLMDQTGDPSAVKQILGRLEPELAKKFEKTGGSPFDILGSPNLAPPDAQSAQPADQASQAPPGSLNTATTGSPTDVVAPPAALPSSRPVGVYVPPPATFTFGGAPLPTPESRAAAAGTQFNAEIAMRRKAAEAQGMAPKDAIEYALNWRDPARLSAQSIESIPGTRADGSPVRAVFDRRPNSPTYGKYLDPDTDKPIIGFVPVTSTASVSLGADPTRVSIELGYGDIKNVKDPAKMAHINAVVLQRQGALKVSQALSAAQAMIPNGTAEQKADLADGLMKGTATPSGPQAPAAVTPADATGKPASGPISSSIPTELKGANKQTGAPMPTSLAKAYVQAKASTDLVDQAIQALEATDPTTGKPFKDDKTLEGSLRMASKYRSGEYDPVAGAASQLADLSGLQAAASQALVAGGSRALKNYVDRRQHVPKVPSFRQTLAASFHIPASLIQGAAALPYGGGDESTIDSPQQMYQKLIRVRDNMQNFIKESESMTPPDLKKKTSGASTSDVPGADGKPYQDANGAWIIP